MVTLFRRGAQGCGRGIQTLSLYLRGLSCGEEKKAGSQTPWSQSLALHFLLGDLGQVFPLLNLSFLTSKLAG
jgi:hypothetical protein